jgi:hypothetical protein
MLATLLACGARSDSPVKLPRPNSELGAIHGDIYLVMQSGDTKRGAGRTVFLARDSDSLQATIGGLCDALAGHAMARLDSALALHRRYLATTKEEDVDPLIAKEAAVMVRNSAEESAARSAIDRAIISQSADTAGSGIGAHYAFRGIAPGRYILFSPWDIGEHHYRFAQPISLAPRDDVSRDLDNSAEHSADLYCPHALTADSILRRIKALQAQFMSR